MDTIRTFRPGVYNIEIDEYHNSNGLSRSGIMLFKKSPLHYWNEYKSESKKIEKSTPAMLLGNAIHSYILEPETFTNKYLIIDKIKRNTKEGKLKYEEATNELNDRILLTQEVFDEVEKISQAFLANEMTKEFVKGAQIEKSLFWHDKDTNILLKCRPDIWHTNMICDIKTTSDASPREFQRAIMNYGYHIQAALIQDGIKAILNKEISDFVFLAIEKNPPYATGIYILDKDSIERGRQEYKSVLENYKETENTNKWCSYKPTVISLPSYY